MINIDQRIAEDLSMAFMGHYIRTPEGEFAPIVDSYGVLESSLKDDIKQLLRDVLEAAKPDKRHPDGHYNFDEEDFGFDEAITDMERKQKELGL